MILAHSAAHGGMENTQERLQTIMAAEMAPPGRKCAKWPFFSFWGLPLDNTEGSVQTAPRTADSTGICMEDPILTSLTLLRVTPFTKSQT